MNLKLDFPTFRIVFLYSSSLYLQSAAMYPEEISLALSETWLVTQSGREHLFMCCSCLVLLFPVDDSVVNQ